LSDDLRINFLYLYTCHNGTSKLNTCERVQPHCSGSSTAPSVQSGCTKTAQFHPNSTSDADFTIFRKILKNLQKLERSEESHSDIEH